jgi:tetratricopeptide (TPR) repeat protein
MTGRLIALFSLLVATAGAQIENESSDVARHLKVRVAFSDHAPCDSSTRVVLNRATGLALAEGSVNGECTAEFFDVPSGRYRVTVSGADAANADQGEIDVNPVVNHDLEVRARHTEKPPGSTYWLPAASFISAADLRMPSKAAKEFEKAEHLIARQEWTKATELLHKGLEMYPGYAAAYNNLGAVYSHLGDNTEAREALQKAIALDDRLAPAYVNLGRLSFVEKDFPSAESLLTKAISLAPAPNAEELFLLGYAQLSDHHLDEALQTSRQGHAEKLNHHASLHLLAANAYEQQNRIHDCISELQLYLNEEPNGSSAEKATRALATLQARASR